MLDVTRYQIVSQRSKLVILCQGTLLMQLGKLVKHEINGVVSAKRQGAPESEKYTNTAKIYIATYEAKDGSSLSPG